MAVWRPRLSPKQLASYECSTRFVLNEGARFCGKTWAFMHKVFRHCWRNNARFGIIVKTTKQGDLGIWPTLTGQIYKEWVDAGVCSDVADFGWVKEPWTDAVTKMRRARIHNRFGGTSDIQLFPIQYSHEAKDVLLSTEWSALWISEGHLYEDGDLIKHATPQLRLPGVPQDEKQILCDTNPPEDGDASWIYEFFHAQRTMRREDYPKFWDDSMVAEFKDIQRQKTVYRFLREDNPYADKQMMAEVAAMYMADEDEYNRMIKGEYSSVRKTLIFRGSFDRNLHVFGSAESANEDEWEVMTPSNSASVERDGGDISMLCGWDPGDVNHSWHAIQPWRNSNNDLCFDILDEFVVTDKTMRLEDLTAEVMRKMKLLEAWLPTEKFFWKHYSDSSVFKFEASAGTDEAMVQTDADMTDAAVIRRASKGEIELIGAGAVKNAGWQRKRCNLLVQLLNERRIRISANCTETIQMFNKLRRPKTEMRGHYIAPDQKTKHPFDSLSYAISMMLIDQLVNESDQPRTSRASLRPLFA